jgi:hypothetical protein
MQQPAVRSLVSSLWRLATRSKPTLADTAMVKSPSSSQSKQRSAGKASAAEARGSGAQGPHDAEHVALLKGMGFSEVDAKDALDKCGGNMETALEYLLAGV